VVSAELSCQEIVELVSDYLEGAMSRTDHTRFENHLAYCPGCATYVEQIRTTILVTGKVPAEETLPPDLRAGLIAQFRHWERESDQSEAT
jgi:predicted anti-sigma-YlaC factor YlaD